MNKCLSPKLRIGISFAVTTSLVLASSSAAIASEPSTGNIAEDAAVVISEALDELTEGIGSNTAVLDAMPTELGYIAMDTGAIVEVAANPDEGVDIFLSKNETALSIALPDLDGMENASKAEDGTIAFSSDEDTVVAVQPLDGGVRMTTVMESASAPTEFSYELELPVGAVLDENEDGSIAILAPVKTETFLPGKNRE